MEIRLKKKPQKPIIIEGFPGLGLVGTIAAEFLIDHLNAEQIGGFYSKDIPAIIAIHKGQVLEPFGIFFDAKNNIVILRPLAVIGGIEWELADTIIKLKNMLKAKEVISLEGIESGPTKEPKALFFTTEKKTDKKLKAFGLEKLNEGMIAGLTASLLSKQPDSTFIFTETHSELPDSRSAAKMIEILDKYLGLDVDYQPLLKKAELFEKKLKEIIGMAVQKSKEKQRSETYLG
jgi:uncharacterized protein